MPLPENRRNRLFSVLEDLCRQVPGVLNATDDDFDSTSVNVFLALDVQSRAGCITSSDRPFRFVTPLRSTKAAIRRVCKQHGVSFNFLNWPAKQYVSDGMGGKSDDGYDVEEIKIEVFV
jgi:hypothetical protein